MLDRGVLLNLYVPFCLQNPLVVILRRFHGLATYFFRFILCRDLGLFLPCEYAYTSLFLLHFLFLFFLFFLFFLLLFLFHLSVSLEDCPLIHHDSGGSHVPDHPPGVVEFYLFLGVDIAHYFPLDT